MAWTVVLIRTSLIQPPYNPRDLLALTSDKRLSRLHGLSYEVKHSSGWTSCTFLFVTEFTANTLNPLLLAFQSEKLTILSLWDFVDRERDEKLLYPVRAIRHYLSHTE